MDSDKVQSSAVMVCTAESVGTGLLIQSSSPDFDYVISARHNLVDLGEDDLDVVSCEGNKFELVDVAYLDPNGPDIAILRVKKTDQANRIPVCTEAENHAHGVLAGYPGALQLQRNKDLELRGVISYSAAESTNFYFEILNAPDPAVYEKNYIAGFSGGGVFQLSESKAEVVLKGIVIQRWDDDFDVKKTRCVKISVITELLDQLGLPPFSGVHIDLSSFLENLPELFGPDFAELIKSATNVERLAGTNVSRLFESNGISLPQSADLYARLIKLPFRVQERLLRETFYAKSVAFAYYLSNAENLNFCDNPVFHEDDLRILICCTHDHLEISSIVFHLTDASHRKFLDKCLVIICALDQSNPKATFGVDSKRTSAIVKNYTRATVDRKIKGKAASYLEIEAPTRGFSVYPIAALSPLIDDALHGLQFEAENDSDYLNDEAALRAIKDALDGTIKS